MLPEIPYLDIRGPTLRERRGKREWDLPPQ